MQSTVRFTISEDPRPILIVLLPIRELPTASLIRLLLHNYCLCVNDLVVESLVHLPLYIKIKEIEMKEG